MIGQEEFGHDVSQQTQTEVKIFQVPFLINYMASTWITSCSEDKDEW